MRSLRQVVPEHFGRLSVALVEGLSERVAGSLRRAQ